MISRNLLHIQEFFLLIPGTEEPLHIIIIASVECLTGLEIEECEKTFLNNIMITIIICTINELCIAEHNFSSDKGKGLLNIWIKMRIFWMIPFDLNELLHMIFFINWSNLHFRIAKGVIWKSQIWKTYDEKFSLTDRLKKEKMRVLWESYFFSTIF